MSSNIRPSSTRCFYVTYKKARIASPMRHPRLSHEAAPFPCIFHTNSLGKLVAPLKSGYRPTRVGPSPDISGAIARHVWGDVMMRRNDMLLADV